MVIARERTFALLAASTAVALQLSCMRGMPAQGTSDWELAAPQSVAMDSVLLEGLRTHAREGAFPNLHAILIVRDGRLVFEEYFNGFERETRQFTASVSKSVGSMLLGIAIDRGLLPELAERGVETPLPDALPEYADLLAEPDKRDLTLQHVLTMSAGLEWDEQSHPYSDPRNDWIRASGSDDPVGFVLRRPVVTEPGTAFNYNGGLSIALAHLVERGAGVSADRFAEQYLFGPLGITDYVWEHLPNGITDTDGGLHLRPRDMAKLGQLYLDGGMWRGTRVVSESWVRESTREHLVTEGQPNYGYQWWCGDFHFGDRSAFTYLASGHGGQKIYVFPDLDLVVVLTHAVFDNPMGELHNSAILARYVLPAATGDTPWPDPVRLDSTELARYVGEYAAADQRFTIAYRDGGLIGTAEGSPPLVLTPVTATQFRGTMLDLVDVTLDFEFAPDGTVLGVRARFMFNDRTYRQVRRQE
jgi:CubicO group peptidase (beta-lactamase class C family)